jgi:hypothetical protein
MSPGKSKKGKEPSPGSKSSKGKQMTIAGVLQNIRTPELRLQRTPNQTDLKAGVLQRQKHAKEEQEKDERWQILEIERQTKILEEKFVTASWNDCEAYQKSSPFFLDACSNESRPDARRSQRGLKRYCVTRL